MADGIVIYAVRYPGGSPVPPDRPAAAAYYRADVGGRLLVTGAVPPCRLICVDVSSVSSGRCPDGLCAAVVRECLSHGCAGAAVMTPGPGSASFFPPLADAMANAGLRLYLPEAYVMPGMDCIALVSTAVSSGSFRQRMTSAAEKFGKDRVAADVMPLRVDYALAPPERTRRELTPGELRRLLPGTGGAVRHCKTLCAGYFTYTVGERAHFTVFDDEYSVMEKLRVIAEVGIREVFVPEADVLRYYL